MHNEPTLQPAREKPLPNTIDNTPAAGATTTTGTTVVPHINGNGAVPHDPTRTPLHEAAAGGDETKVETLLAAGADRNAKESVHGNTPLHEASWKGYSRCVKLLCALPKTKPSSGGTGKSGLSLDLLKDATKIKHALHDTKGALHSALLGTRNFGGFSALHLAAQNGHNQSCREILLAGADPDVQNNYGDSPLHTACRYGHAGAIRILLSAKCDFERINLNGDTALHIACAMGRRKLTRILLEAGCRQDTKNAQDETPRDIAQRKNLVEIINILNTPVDLSARRSRERSSSSSQHQRNKTEALANGGATVRHKSPAHDPAGNERRSRSKDEAGRKSGRRSNSNDETRADAIDPKHWSPYGCHYFPDPRNFPSPKLETLPKEPLGNGEQYFLDLAGNIRKGPVGVGNTCYCAPFFKHLEQRMNQNRRSIRKYVHRATEKLDSRMTALAMRTDDQIEELTKSMIASRVQCENKRLHLEQWLKRGIAERSTTTATSGGLEHSNSKTKKDEANTNTLTRCRSLELLDDHDAMLLANGVDGLVDDQLRKSSTPTRQLFSRSIDFLDAATNGDSDHHHAHRAHRQQHQHQQELESHLRLLQYAAAAAGGHQSDALESSNNSNMKNHSESAETPPIPADGVEGIRISRRPRSSSMSGRESYSYSSDNNKDNDREKPPRLLNGGHELKGVKKRSLSSMPTSSTPTSAISSNGAAPPATAKSEKAKVTERLEELLTKTKKILELEKMTKGGGGGGGGLVSSPLLATHPNTAITPTTAATDNRYVLALDKLRDIHHYEPSSASSGSKPLGRSARDSPGYDIAQEMEKITKSLLPAAPVSPEIAKDITTRKERPTTVLYASSYHQQQSARRTTPQGSSPLSTTPLSTMSPSSSLLGGQTAPSRSSPLFGADHRQHHHLASTNFMEDQPREEQTRGEVTAAMGVLMNGFYSNSCFEEGPPSSSNNTTIKSVGPSRQQHRQSEEEEEEEDEEEEEEDEEEEEEAKEEEEEEEEEHDEEDLSDRCDLSAMANLAELKELKSRILNGTNWRSQVLQKSVQELLRSGEGGVDADAGPSEQDASQTLGETNRVKYIISKLQQSGISGGDVAVRTQQHQVPPMARCEDFSDSSSEEEEEEEEEERQHEQVDHDEDCVDGPPLPMNGELDPEKPATIGTAKTLIQLYEQSSSTAVNGGGAIGKPAPANGPTSFASVPKDAYFHELPARKLLPPPELSSMAGLTSSRVHQTARSRNPLPSYLLQEGAGELFQQQAGDILEQQQQQGYFDELHFQSHHRSPVTAMSSYPIPADGFLPPVGLPTPVNHHHHHPHGHSQLQQQQQQQQQEKLLSTRKYMNPSSAVSLASTGTPSPEFPLYHQHQQPMQPSSSTTTITPQPAYPGSAGTASVIGGHSHAMMTMMAAAAGRKSVDQLSSNGEDSGYVSGKVSEIHIPSGGASPLLSAGASNVLIIPPPASSGSPKHFLPSYPGHHHHHHSSLVPAMHQRGNGTPPHQHGSVVTSIVPPPVGPGVPPPAGMHPTTGQTTAQLHAAVEQKQQALYKLGASSLV